MAKNFVKPRKHESGRTITTKTPYGSTSDMIVTDEEIVKKVIVADFAILLQDDEGYYVTHKNRVDSGLADPFRHDNEYRLIMDEKIFKDLGS